MWILTRCFPPRSNIAARRYAGLSPHLKDLGWNPWIITLQESSYNFGQAPGSLEVSLPESQVLRLPALENPLSSSATILHHFKQRFLSAVGTFALSPLGRRLLANWCKVYSLGHKFDDFGRRDSKTVLQACKERNFPKPDIIICSIPPGGAILLGRELAAELNSLLVVDFRDLQALRDNRPQLTQALDRLLESRILASASGAICVTPYSSKLVNKAYGLPSATVMNGYEPASSLAALPCSSAPRYYYYAGILYRHQLPALVLFFSQLRSYLPHSGNKLLMRLLPTPDSGLNESVEQLIIQLDLADYIKTLPPAPADQVQKEAQISLCNLVFEELCTDHEYSRGTLTGKLLELINYPPPVLAIARSDSDIGLVLKESQAGLLVSSKEEIIQAFPVIANWNKEKRLDSFLRPVQAKSLADFLDKLISKNSG